MKWIPGTAASINTRNGLVDLQNGLRTCQYTLSPLNEMRYLIEEAHLVAPPRGDRGDQCAVYVPKD